MTCHDYEVWLEQRQHGALAPEAAAELEAHLAACPSCRSYAGLARDTEQTMQTAGADLERRIDWEQVRRAVARGSRRYRLEQWAGIGLGVVVIGSLLVMLGAAGRIIEVEHFVGLKGRPPALVLLASVACAVPFFAFTFAHLRRRFAAARDAQRSDAASLDWVRRELDGKIRQRRRIVFLDVVVCCVIATAGFVSPPAAPLPAVAIVTFRVLLFAILGIALADSAYGLFIELPRFQRERAELGE